jgi:hypothetical protein
MLTPFADLVFYWGAFFAQLDACPNTEPCRDNRSLQCTRK